MATERQRTTPKTEDLRCRSVSFGGDQTAKDAKRLTLPRQLPESHATPKEGHRRQRVTSALLSEEDSQREPQIPPIPLIRARACESSWEDLLDHGEAMEVHWNLRNLRNLWFSSLLRRRSIPRCALRDLCAEFNGLEM